MDKTLADLKFDERMPRAIHARLCNYLQSALRSPKDCHGHGFDHTIAFLSTVTLDVPGALAWLAEHGGHCDCEVILNTFPWGEFENAW